MTTSQLTTHSFKIPRGHTWTVMATACSAPVRRLFAEQRSESCRRRESSERISEVEQICRKSVQRLRELFSFDLDCMAPVSVTSNKENSRNTYPTTACSTPTTPHPETENAHGYWLWQQMDLKHTYVPEFYHPKRYHSDSHLVASKTQNRLRIPQTPRKQRGSTQKLFDEKDHILSDKTERKNPLSNSGMPTLFQIWGPRIRRSSYSDPEQSDIKGTRCRASARSGSSGRNPDKEIALFSSSLEVPVNSPVKQTTLNGKEKLEKEFVKSSSKTIDEHVRRSRSLTPITSGRNRNRPRVSISVSKKYHQTTLTDCFSCDRAVKSYRSSAVIPLRTD